MLVACHDSSENKQNSGLLFTDYSVDANLNYILPVIPTAFLDSMAGGIAVADINHDGWLDFAVAHGKNSGVKLFLNEKNGSFMDITNQSGVYSTHHARGVFFIDINDDGEQDLIVSEGSSASRNLVIYKNKGTNQFEDITIDTGLLPSKPTYSISAGDYDLDGDLDIAMGHWQLGRDGEVQLGEYLWENESGSFVIKDEKLPIPAMVYPPELLYMDSSDFTFTPSFSDVNNDGYLDLLMVSDYDNVQYFFNNDGLDFTLADVPKGNAENGMGSAIGDYDNNGTLDWFITSIYSDIAPLEGGLYGTTGNRLYKNDGKGVFADVTEFAGVRNGGFGWGACFGDFDNDGYLDLFHVAGMGNNDLTIEENGEAARFLNNPAKFFYNNGDGTFTQMAENIGLVHFGQGRGISCFDYDNDGDLDILISNNGRAPSLFKNDSENENNFLKIKLQGFSPNSQMLGSKLWVTTNINEIKSTQLRELRLGSSYLSSDPALAHFGLGKAMTADLRIEWYDKSRTVSVLTSVEANQTLVIKHPNLNN
jgi:hypothetical protein